MHLTILEFLADLFLVSGCLDLLPCVRFLHRANVRVNNKSVIATFAMVYRV
jgi:hypothetical protein